MFHIRIAGLKVGIDNQYQYVKTLCRDYVAEDDETPAFTVCCSCETRQDEIAEHAFSVSPALAESICIYREICMRLFDYDAFVLHAAVVVMNREAFAFLAPSGIGKTTHIRQWLTRFGENVFVLNGDKPLIRRIDGIWYAFGTPWCGKEGFNRNTSAPLRALCFLERGDKNLLRETSPDELIDRLTAQLLMPHEADKVCRLFDSLNDVLRQAVVKTLICMPNENAAETAYNGLRGRTVTENHPVEKGLL